MRKAIIIIGIVLLVVIAIMPTCRSDSPKVSVTFVGYTNDSTGVRLATFAFKNLGQSAVTREPSCWVETPGARREDGKNLYQNWLMSGWGSKLLPGKSETLLVVVPTNQPTWRISLGVRHPEILTQ